MQLIMILIVIILMSLFSILFLLDEFWEDLVYYIASRRRQK